MLNRFFFSLIAFWVICQIATAQVKININDVKKINLIDAEGALGFGRTTEFELLPATDGWVCNQTKQKYNVAPVRPGDQSYYVEENAVQQKFVKKVHEQTIVDFLKSIAIVKPMFSSAALGITPQTILHYADTSKFADKAKKNLTAEQMQIILTEASKPEHIKEAIDSLQHDWWTDDYPYCGILVVLKNNDTVKVESNRQPGYMLPWRINKVNSYDLDINRFFIAVMSDYKKSNKSRLNGSYLPYQIWDYCYRTFGENALIRDYWQKHNPAFDDKLKANFKIKDLRNYSNANGRLIDAKLQPYGLPDKVVIKLGANIDSTKYLDKLVLYADSIRQYFKQGNFVFDYYQKKAVNQIVFSWFNDSSLKWFSPEAQIKFNQLIKNHPEYSMQNIARFTVDGGYHEDSQWILLPDGKLVLLVFFEKDVAGLKGNPLHKTGTLREECFVVFDKSGNILYQL